MKQDIYSQIKIAFAEQRGRELAKLQEWICSQERQINEDTTEDVVDYINDRNIELQKEIDQELKFGEIEDAGDLQRKWSTDHGLRG